MFSNFIPQDCSPARNDNSQIINIYQKFQNLLGRGTELGKEHNMLSARGSATNSEDNYFTPVSSSGDLMMMSPERSNDVSERHENTSDDLLTGTEFDSICDVTMREIPMLDASSVDYLAKCAISNPNCTHVDRGKESLFVKFDPLYSLLKRENTGSVGQTESVTNSSECDVGYETSSAASGVMENNIFEPKICHSDGLVHLACVKDKPTQVVAPVVNSDVPKLNPCQTRSTPALVRSVSAILTPTHVATDRLINISGSTPPRAAPRSPRFKSNYSMHELNHVESVKAILQKQAQEIINLRQENRDFKYLLKDMEHKNSRLNDVMESKIKKLTEEKDMLMERESRLMQQINDKIISNKQMSIVIEEYEKTISSLIGEQQRDKLANQELHDLLTSERDQALNHVSCMEISFNDVLSKYEKCKSVILEVKDREKIFEKKLDEYEAGMKKYEKLYNNLEQITTDKLTMANETLENIKKNHNVDITKLNATIRKHEITIASLQESLVQKTRDNEELTKICDQLING